MLDTSRLAGCTPRKKQACDTSFSLLFRLLIVNALLGVRQLRDVFHYRGEPVVRRTLDVSHLPSVPTISRMLERCDEHSVSKLQGRKPEIVTERLALEKLSTVTLDFDGTVISTNGKAEGSAVVFNKNVVTNKTTSIRSADLLLEGRGS